MNFRESEEKIKILKKKLKRNQFISVRFSAPEKKRLKELAAEQNQTLSELIRAFTLSTSSLSRHTLLPQINRNLYFELGKLSEYLQAIEPGSEALSEIQERLNQIARKLIGLDCSPD